jgi:hypothetical protein
MTPEQLNTIAAEAAGGCSTCVELVAEVRRLTAERDALLRTLLDVVGLAAATGSVQVNSPAWRNARQVLAASGVVAAEPSKEVAMRALLLGVRR